jgi:hypothetical protein
MARKVIFDCKCDSCNFSLSDVYDEPGLGNYGNCQECKTGVMRQVIGAVNHSFATPPDTASKGRTTNGMKWEVGSKPKSYNPATGTYK